MCDKGVSKGERKKVVVTRLPTGFGLRLGHLGRDRNLVLRQGPRVAG